MIFFQSGNSSFLSFGIEVAVSILAQITPGSTKGTTGNIYIEAKVLWVRTFIFSGRKMGFAGKDRMVPILFKESGQRGIFARQSFPVPTCGPLIFGFWVDPLGNPVPSGVLPGHQRHPGRGTNGLGIELRKPDALSGQAFHVWGAVKFVERMLLGLALFVYQHGHGGVHQTHVVHQEKNHIGLSIFCENTAPDKGIKKRGYKNFFHALDKNASCWQWQGSGFLQ